MRSHKDKMHGVIARGQSSGAIRADVDSLSLFRTIFGGMRLLVKQWCLSGFAFDLLKEGEELWKAQRRLIATGDYPVKKMSLEPLANGKK